MVSGADAEFFFSAISERNGFPPSTVAAVAPPLEQLAVSDAFLSVWMGDGGSSSGSSSNSDSSASTLLTAFERRLQESVQSGDMLEMYVESYDSFEVQISDVAASPVGEGQSGRGKKRNVQGNATTLQHLPQK
jgi:hypothetical protein